MLGLGQSLTSMPHNMRDAMGILATLIDYQCRCKVLCKSLPHSCSLIHSFICYIMAARGQSGPLDPTAMKNIEKLKTCQNEWYTNARSIQYFVCVITLITVTFTGLCQRPGRGAEGAGTASSVMSMAALWTYPRSASQL